MATEERADSPRRGGQEKLHRSSSSREVAWKVLLEDTGQDLPCLEHGRHLADQGTSGTEFSKVGTQGMRKA